MPAGSRRAVDRRAADREETERRLIAAFDRVWTRDGIQGLGVNAVLKEAGVGKALLYRYFGDFVGLARAWAQGETFLPRPAGPAGSAGPAGPARPGGQAGGVAASTPAVPAQGAVARGAAVDRHVESAMAYAQALRSRPKTRELLAIELLGSSPLTQALDGMRAQFGREMRQFVMASGAAEGEDAFALSFFVTAAMTYLSMRADHVPHYYGLRLDREEDWPKVERMLRLVAERVLQPEGAVSASPSADAPPPQPP